MFKEKILSFALIGFLLSCCPAEDVPFILTKEHAIYIDSKIGKSICSFSKSDSHSRYYYYSIIAREGKFEINAFAVRFVFIEDGRNRVHATTGFPIEYEQSPKLKAFGEYNLGNEKIEKVTCIG
jgi:hypothetical protein